MTVEYEGKVVRLSLEQHRGISHKPDVCRADVEFIISNPDEMFATGASIRVDDPFRQLILGQAAKITIVF